MKMSGQQSLSAIVHLESIDDYDMMPPNFS